ncbi:NLRC3 protein [Phytophthora cinnamomi]|uniref:NLRC3 protein n=1 Tax=Phytophthora cinnamomi TaxID=4785 RepID=UPI003559A600|nr:NLRC3 protein [Phytophthora cinnamomi]
MGVGQSKGGGGVRWKLQPLVPRSWAELEQLHLRFQQEAHRRRGDPSFQYFLPFPVFQTIVAPLCPDKDKLQLLAMFEALDVNGRHKLAVMDFFSGLALLVDAKKPQKLEFVLSLLDNGGLKTLNKCGADDGGESTMRPLIRRLFGDNDEVLLQNVVNKALADPEILFFMSDLEAGVATSSDELLIQQGKLMRHMAYLDYQAARVKTTEEKGRVSAAVPFSIGPNKVAESQRTLTSTSAPTAENFARRLQSIVCPPPPKGLGQSMRVLSAVEVKKYVDARTLQRLVRAVSDGGLSLSTIEAATLIGDMAVDQVGLVRCGDIVQSKKESQVDYDSDESQPEEVDDESMRLIINFLLNPEITDEDGIDLASSMEKSLQQEQVWPSFASFWTKFSVTVHSAVRSVGGIQPVLGKYLRVCINFREDFVSNVEECTGTSFAAGIRSFSCWVNSIVR